MGVISHLLPLYLQLEQRICALIRLLTLALQFCAIIEHKVRASLPYVYVATLGFL